MNLSKLIVENGFDQVKYQRILLEDWFIKYKPKVYTYFQLFFIILYYILEGGDFVTIVF